MNTSMKNTVDIESAPNVQEITPIPQSIIDFSDGQFLSRMLVRLYQAPNHDALVPQLIQILDQKYQIQVDQPLLFSLKTLLGLLVYSHDMRDSSNKSSNEFDILQQFGKIERTSQLGKSLLEVLPILREHDNNFIKIPFMKRVIGLKGNCVLREKLGEAKGEMRWQGTWDCVDGEKITMEMDRATVQVILNGMNKIKDQLKMIS